ncbi:MAG: MHS family MFS transporter [Planctomycetes bacterium]|nr:MHS family MFS transporter [Planctomycetota bacterium]
MNSNEPNAPPPLPPLPPLPSPSAAPQSEVAAAAPLDAKGLRGVIVASSVGTLFEWYDFYLYGSLAVFFSDLFFPPGNERATLLASLATFGAGFAVRPLGALVFGRIGDLVGRKYTFLVTIVTMGLSTALIGLLPSYASAGWFAPVALVLLRLIQGLALGGEYGGAATYVAEHVPDERRGWWTSFIQTTATLGFFLSLGVIGATRVACGEESFRAWGWRIPFLVSFVLLALSLWIRLRMRESPLFAKLKREGRVAKNPLKESFTNRVNLRYVLLALFGATAGQGVVWYTGQFYALTFLQKSLGLSWQLAYGIVAGGLLLGTPLFLVFGAWSDRVGRKKVMLGGMAAAALTWLPIYRAMTALGNPDFAGAVTELPAANVLGLVLLLFVQMAWVAMVYGPIAAFLVELFPTSIRYTSMSLPYHLGNGWFGGFLPLIATTLTTSPWVQQRLGADAAYAGLAYPIAVCVMSLVIGGALLPETRLKRIDRAEH